MDQSQAEFIHDHYFCSVGPGQGIHLYALWQQWGPSVWKPHKEWAEGTAYERDLGDTVSCMWLC